MGSVGCSQSQRRRNIFLVLIFLVGKRGKDAPNLGMMCCRDCGGKGLCGFGDWTEL